VFQDTRDIKAKAFAVWITREGKVLDTDLESRFIQKAIDRYSRIRQSYLDFYAHNAVHSEYALSIPAKYAAISEKIQAVLNRTELLTETSPWIFQFSSKPNFKNSKSAHVFLVEIQTKEKWKGPISLIVSKAIQKNNSTCPMEINPSGSLDLSKAFLECKMEPGTWKLTWLTGGQSLHSSVDVQWQPIDLSLVFKTDGVAISRDLRTHIQNQIATLHSPYYRIVPAHAGIQELVIHLREFVQDSLDGMHFVSLGATVLFPGNVSVWKVRGKSGHSDQAHARERAILDWMGALERLPVGGMDSGLNR
jgi:hypothetical protein